NHTLNMKCRCELDVDDTRRGSAQIRFDGEDHVHLYLNTSGNWTTDDAKAQRVLEKWDPEGMMAEDWRHSLSSTCSSWLELFVHNKTNTEERKANHVLQYVTTITPAINSTSGELDGEQFVYYGSNVTEVILKTEWIKMLNKNERNYCNSEKRRMLGEYDDLQHLLNLAVEVFNNTKDEKKDPPTNESQRSHVITAVVFVIFFIVSVPLFIKYWLNS
ncbi:MHC class I antigen, partial [Clarias magur]